MGLYGALRSYRGLYEVIQAYTQTYLDIELYTAVEGYMGLYWAVWVCMRLNLCPTSPTFDCVKTNG